MVTLTWMLPSWWNLQQWAVHSASGKEQGEVTAAVFM